MHLGITLKIMKITWKFAGKTREILEFCQFSKMRTLVLQKEHFSWQFLGYKL